MPTDEADLRRLGRAMGLRNDPVRSVVELWQAQAREVRRIHERLFYRPLLAAAARLDITPARSAPRPRASGWPRWASGTRPGRCATSRR